MGEEVKRVKKRMGDDVALSQREQGVGRIRFDA